MSRVWGREGGDRCWSVLMLPTLKALIGAASEFAGPGFLLPARNAELYRWSLAHGLKVVQVMTLMTLGLYNEPAGAYLPSVLY